MLVRPRVLFYRVLDFVEDLAGFFDSIVDGFLKDVELCDFGLSGFNFAFPEILCFFDKLITESLVGRGHLSLHVVCLGLHHFAS